MFAALGVKVTLVEARTQFLSFLAHEIGRALERSMRERLGIEIRKGHRWGKIHHDGDGKLRCDLADGSVLDCEKLLFAAGRVGNTDGLGLESVGLSANDRGALEVDDRFRTKVPSIYAAGDVIGFPALASTSMEQARLAVCHAFDIAYKRTSRASGPTASTRSPRSVASVTRRRAARPRASRTWSVAHPTATTRAACSSVTTRA
jgi:NAD(P) transhydrogenase